MTATALLLNGPQEVQFYSAHARDLLQTQQHKIKKFIEHNCIAYAGNGVFICKPIPGYNKTTYEMMKGSTSEFECNCQYFQSKKRKGESAYCSHIGALFENFARRRKYESKN